MDPLTYIADGCTSGSAATNCLNAFGALNGPADQGYETYETFTYPCGNLEEPDDCEYWAPGNFVEINPTSGVYEVDTELVDGLVEDPSPLVDCDAGRFDWVDPGFELTGASAGELTYVLGLVNGDTPTELNNYPLDTFDEVFEVFLVLWVRGETEFTLELNRGLCPSPFTTKSCHDGSPLDDCRTRTSRARQRMSKLRSDAA